MTSPFIPPVIRALAPAAALALLLSACGLFRTEEPSPAETEESTSGETESSTEEEGGSDKQGSSQTASLADPGILTAECEAEFAWIEFTLYSTEDAREIANVRFDTADAVHAESDHLSHGRAVDPQNVFLETSCHESAPSLFPERHLVLGTFKEQVNGNLVSGFGVMAEDGTFTALSPEQEVSDFANPTEYLFPVADPENDRILFVEDTGESGGEGTVQALDLESGEITDLGTCEKRRICKDLTIMPGLDGAVIEGGQSTPLAVVFDGSAVVQSSGQGFTFFDIEDQADEGVVDLTLSFTNRDRATEVDVDARGVAQAIDANTLLFDDDVLSVLELTENTLSSYEEDNASTPRNLWEPLPVDRTLVPEGSRNNSTPVLSPDGSEVLFHSDPQTGTASWYKVPTDGSSEPEEFTALPENLPAVLGWQ